MGALARSRQTTKTFFERDVMESESVTRERIRSRTSAEEWFVLLQEEAGTFESDEHARRFWTLLEYRIAEHNGLIEESTTKTEPTQYRAMTEDEAKRFEQSELTFGKFTGKRVADVELSYLEWLDGDEFRWKLHRYLKSDRVQRETQG